MTWHAAPVDLFEQLHYETVIPPGEIEAARVEYHGTGQYAIANGGQGPNTALTAFRLRNAEPHLYRGHVLNDIVAALQTRFAAGG